MRAAHTRTDRSFLIHQQPAFLSLLSHVERAMSKLLREGRDEKGSGMEESPLIMHIL